MGSGHRLALVTTFLLGHAGLLHADDPSGQSLNNVKPTSASGATSAIGPDLIVASVSGTRSYGSGPDQATGEATSAFSVGFTLCNIGDEPAVFVDHNNQHPIITSNMYRLKDGRFEQIGLSWVVHTFYAVNNDCSGSNCVQPGGAEGEYLGVNCSDAESAHIVGVQSNLGPRSTVNAFTGFFPFPINRVYEPGALTRRIQVRSDDLDPQLNPGALYFVEAQVVSPDDAAAGNGANNASYKRVSFARPSPTVAPPLCPTLDPITDWCAVLSTQATRKEMAAIHAWKEVDPEVQVTEVHVPGEGLLILAAKVTELDDGYWRYEYAVQNINSHRSASSFSIPVCLGMEIENVGFHDVDYHDGEPWDGADWPATVEPGSIRWSTTPYNQNPNANALRWSTLYNFRFDANAPPERSWATIGLIRPGNPPEVRAQTAGPFRWPDCIDSDRDGESDCLDLCPSTPPGTCTCQGIGECCVGCLGPCWLEYPRDACVDGGGRPDGCGDPRCTNGCPLFDMDNDGDRDLADFGGLQRCFSGPAGDSGYVAPAQECMNRLDADNNGAIDLGDYKLLFQLGLLGQ